MNDTVTAYLDGLPDRRRADAEALLALMERATGETPGVARNIVGFGTYHYQYDSGREGDSPAAAFAMRKQAITVYLMDGVAAHEDELARLGPHTTGVGCVYLKSLDGIDLAVLEGIVRGSYATLTAGTWGNSFRGERA